MPQVPPNSEDPSTGASLGPPRAHVLTLTDFDKAGALFPNWQGRLEQLSNGSFTASIQIVVGRWIRITGVQANQRVLLRGRDSAGLISLYPVCAGNAGGLWQGHRLEPGQIVAHGPNAEIDHCSARQPQSLAGYVQKEALERAARHLLNSDGLELPQNWMALNPPPELYTGLNQHFAHLLEAGLGDPSVLGTPEGYQLEQECIRSIVSVLFPAQEVHPQLSLSARAALLRRAEELMRSRLGESLGAIDLCQELSVSDRTLRLAFHERYGLGPMAYFKCLRLNAVRMALKTNPLVGIATVARSHGFHHLGNFANDYRRIFGELPSATQRAVLPEPGPEIDRDES